MIRATLRAYAAEFGASGLWRELRTYEPVMWWALSWLFAGAVFCIALFGAAVVLGGG